MCIYTFTIQGFKRVVWRWNSMPLCASLCLNVDCFLFQLLFSVCTRIKDREREKNGRQKWQSAKSKLNILRIYFFICLHDCVPFYSLIHNIWPPSLFLRSLVTLHFYGDFPRASKITEDHATSSVYIPLQLYLHIFNPTFVDTFGYNRKMRKSSKAIYFTFCIYSWHPFHFSTWLIVDLVFVLFSTVKPHLV